MPTNVPTDKQEIEIKIFHTITLKYSILYRKLHLCTTSILFIQLNNMNLLFHQKFNNKQQHKKKATYCIIIFYLKEIFRMLFYIFWRCSPLPKHAKIFVKSHSLNAAIFHNKYFIYKFSQHTQYTTTYPNKAKKNRSTLS